MTDSTLLGTLAYVFPSVLGGVAVVALGLLGTLVLAAVRTGRPAQVVGLVVVALLALLARRSLPALLATNAVDPLRRRYSRRGLVVGSAVGTVVVLASARVHPIAPFVVFVASWVPLVFTATFPTTGHVDLEHERLVVDGTAVPLQSARGVRTLSVGTVVVCWLSYSRGVPSAPRLVVLPASVVESVERLLDRSSRATAGDRSTIGSQERLLAWLFGLAMVAVAPVLWLALPPGDGHLIALYAGATFGLFGTLLLWYALRA